MGEPAKFVTDRSPGLLESCREFLALEGIFKCMQLRAHINRVNYSMPWHFTQNAGKQTWNKGRRHTDVSQLLLVTLHSYGTSRST